AVVVVKEIPAVDVVDVPVQVVVHAGKAGGLDRIGPDIGRQVGMVNLDAFVDDADGDGAAADMSGLPGLAGLAAERIRVPGRRVAEHAPQIAVGVTRVVRDIDLP